jgi:hypothetical protein
MSFQEYHCYRLDGSTCILLDDLLVRVDSTLLADLFLQVEVR